MLSAAGAPCRELPAPSPADRDGRHRSIRFCYHPSPNPAKVARAPRESREDVRAVMPHFERLFDEVSAGKSNAGGTVLACVAAVSKAR